VAPEEGEVARDQRTTAPNYLAGASAMCLLCTSSYALRV